MDFCFNPCPAVVSFSSSLGISLLVVTINAFTKALWPNVQPFKSNRSQCDTVWCRFGCLCYLHNVASMKRFFHKISVNIYATSKVSSRCIEWYFWNLAIIFCLLWLPVLLPKQFPLKSALSCRAVNNTPLYSAFITVLTWVNDTGVSLHLMTSKVEGGYPSVPVL